MLLWKETLTVMNLKNKRQIKIFFLKAKLYTHKFKYNSPVSMFGFFFFFFKWEPFHDHKKKFKSKLLHDIKGIWLSVMPLRCNSLKFCSGQHTLCMGINLGREKTMHLHQKIHLQCNSFLFHRTVTIKKSIFKPHIVTLRMALEDLLI